jgi:hypothetical protein
MSDDAMMSFCSGRAFKTRRTFLSSDRNIWDMCQDPNPSDTFRKIIMVTTTNPSPNPNTGE